MKKDSKIYIAGHRGMVGSALVRKLKSEGYTKIIIRTHKELDLTNQEEVRKFFQLTRPEYIFMAAAKVGGIGANSQYKGDFIYNNLMIQTNIIHNAHKIENTKKLLFLGSSCIYPRNCPQPIKEEYLMTSELEKTNDAYATAKIAGIKMCQSYREQYGDKFICAMPTNLYGPNDNYNLNTSHVFPALIRKFHEAKINNKSEVIIWGTGAPKREFLHVDDLADALIFLMKNYNDSEIVNIGTGVDLSVRSLAVKMKKIIEFNGNIEFDSSKPDGTPRKVLDVSKIHSLGWNHKIDLGEGIERTYGDYIKESIQKEIIGI